MRLVVPLIPVVITVERKKPGEAFRWRLRTAMIAVAVVAVVMALGLFVSRREERAEAYRQLAMNYSWRSSRGIWQQKANEEAAYNYGLESELLAAAAKRLDAEGDGPGAARNHREAAERAGIAKSFKEQDATIAKRTAYYDRLEEKYRLAADRPLIPVLPDESEPR